MYKILYLPTACEITSQEFYTKESAEAWIQWVYSFNDKAYLLEVVEVEDVKS